MEFRPSAPGRKTGEPNRLAGLEIADASAIG
jgi:hypothetical protein